MTYICAACLEGYTQCALTKTAYNNAACIGKRLYEMAKSKGHLDWQLERLKQVNNELLVLTLTNQSSETASSTVTPPPYNAKGGSTETWPTLAPYTDNNVYMEDASDEATTNLYGE